MFTLRRDLQQGDTIRHVEKLSIPRRGQAFPSQAHALKVEGIIVHIGATLTVQLHQEDGNGAFAEDRGGKVRCTGSYRDFAPGEKPRLAAGASVSLRPADRHAVRGEGCHILIGKVNDHETGNIFRNPVGHFATISADAAPVHLPVSDDASWMALNADLAHVTRTLRSCSATPSRALILCGCGFALHPAPGKVIIDMLGVRVH